MINGKYILKIKLKSLRRPIKLEVNDFAHISKLFCDLKGQNEFISIGQVVGFNRNEIKYITVKED